MATLTVIEATDIPEIARRLRKIEKALNEYFKAEYPSAIDVSTQMECEAIAFIAGWVSCEHNTNGDA